MCKRMSDIYSDNVIVTKNRCAQATGKQVALVKYAQQMATTMTTFETVDARVVSPEKIHTRNLLNNHPRYVNEHLHVYTTYHYPHTHRAYMEPGGHLSSLLAKRIYLARLHAPTQISNTPSVRATKEMLDSVLDTLATRVTKRFTWDKKEGDQCHPAMFWWQSKHFHGRAEHMLSSSWWILPHM